MADPPHAFLPYQPVLGRENSPTGSAGGSQPPAPTKPTYSKRGKITIVACVPCRKRKTKCDGKRPACSQCQGRDSQCLYDMNEDQRKLTYLRENIDSLDIEKRNLEGVIWHLRNSTEDEAHEILRRIRNGADPHSLVQQIQASRSLTRVKGDSLYFGSSTLATGPFGMSRDPYQRLIHTIAVSTPSETESIIQRIRSHEPVDRILNRSPGQDTSPSRMDLDMLSDQPTSFFQARPMPQNSLAPPLTAPGMPQADRAPAAHTPPNLDEQHWTQVTEDKEFVQHLLDVYFTWQHSFFQNFPESLFRKDFKSGHTNHCSRVLVNAICAAGCLLSERPEARGDPNDPETAGAGFFEEGTRLLNQSDRSSIPTTAGVFILSHVEGYRGRLGAMWGLVGRSARMALDLGLHLRNEKTPSQQMDTEDRETESARLHAFWGCFVSDQVTSLTLGRVPQLLTHAITVELPPVDEAADEEPWGLQQQDISERPGARATSFRQCVILSKLVNSTLLMYYAPSEIVRGKLLIDEYNRYLRWYSRLPQIVASTDDAPAHVLCLHLYYHASILLMFRPYIRAKLTESDIVPSEICRQAATAISDIFAKHLALYGTTGIYTFQIQCLLSACTIHLINLPAISATSALRNACESFHILVSRNTWAVGSIQLIKGLITRWNIILPGDVEEALYKPHAELPHGVSERFQDPAAPQAESLRGSKRAAFLNPSTHVLQKRQRLAPVQGPSSNQPEPNKVGSSLPEISTNPGTSSKSDNSAQTNFLFVPFPNQTIPLLGPVHTSTSEDDEWNEEMSKVAQEFDGLRFVGDGWFDPFMGL